MNDGQSYDGIAIFFLILAATLIVVVIRLRKKLKRREQKEKELSYKLIVAEKELDNLRLERLKFQLSPHTIVNSISQLTNFASKTVDGLNGLNTIMSFMLHEGNEPLITLQQEWAFLSAYIKINTLKFSPLIILQKDNAIHESDPISSQKLIPPFLTAYFVENAFKHGDTSEYGEFYIKIAKQENMLIYSVKNKIASLGATSEKSHGIGKKNLSERLRIIYPNQHRIHYKSEQGYYTALIEIDLHKR